MKCNHLTLLAAVAAIAASPALAQYDPYGNVETQYNKRTYYSYDPTLTPAPQAASPSYGGTVDNSIPPRGSYPNYTPPPPRRGDFVAVEADLIKEESGIRYIVGGVGEEEMRQIKAVENEFNLKVLSTMPGGEFVGDYIVNISNAGGEVLEVLTDGPLFLVNLPAGTYTITAHRPNSETKTQKVTVGKSGQKQVRFVFTMA